MEKILTYIKAKMIRNIQAEQQAKKAITKNLCFAEGALKSSVLRKRGIVGVHLFEKSLHNANLAIV